jgi:hypothetical protein
MHFSPKNLCSRCAAAFPRMISVGVTVLYYSNFIPQHTCRPSVARSRSFPTCERGVANPWSVRITIISGSICTTVQSDREPGTARACFPTLTSSWLAPSEITRPTNQPLTFLLLPAHLVNKPSAQARQVYFPIHRQAYAQHAVTLPSPKPQEPGPASCSPRRLNNIAAAPSTPLLPHDTTRYSTGP